MRSTNSTNVTSLTKLRSIRNLRKVNFMKKLSNILMKGFKANCQGLIYILLFCSFSIYLPSLALEKKPITFKVVYGDRITTYILSKTKKGGNLVQSNNLGNFVTKEISKSNFSFLSSKVNKFPKESNDQKFCTRNFIEVNANKERKIACLGASNKLAKDVLRTTNLMSILF